VLGQNVRVGRIRNDGQSDLVVDLMGRVLPFVSQVWPSD
jgi:hypothetical protein